MEISQETSSLLSLISQFHAYGETQEARRMISTLTGFPRAVAEEIVQLTPGELDTAHRPAPKRFAIGYYKWARKSLGIN